MTTKFKIIIGFSIMILLLGGVALIGYLNLQKSSDAFISFQRQADMNVASSDLVGNINQALLKTFEFMRTHDEAAIEEALKIVDQFSEITKTAEETTQTAYRKETFQNLRKQMPGFKAAMEAVRDNRISLLKQYMDVIRPNYMTMSKLLVEVGDAAVRMQNLEALRILIEIMDDFGFTVSALGRFSQSASEEDAKAVQERFIELEQTLKTLYGTLQTEATRKAYRDLYAAYEAMLTAVQSMVKNAATMGASIDSLLRYEKEISATITAFSSRVDGEMRSEGEELLNSSAAARNTMLIISLAGVILGVALAAVTIIGIVKVLHDMAVFAQAIADGNFEHEVRSREKGEIGAMISAMRQIPATLNSVLDEYRMLESSIENGKLTVQGNADNFRGGFSTIIQGTNAVLQRFLTVIENIPSPVVMLDKDRKAAFINTVARKLAGENYEGKSPSELFACEDSGTDRDAMKKALESKSPANAETRAHPQGADMDVSYTVIPMLNAKGEISSIMQLYTDLTDIKTQQRTMLNVARQASEISNRVAAASEQLSAQVEQVSRGAEMQRDRVESTASAMTEMNSTVLEVARSAGEASEQSEKTRDKANDGASLVNQVVQSITQVDNVAMTLQNNMKELGEQAESIGGVMNVISDIADQTNLLALNAAIEAARAGEAGRGFAVVADEVRKLAEKTMQATHEVGASITAIQQSARTNINEVGDAVKNIHDATDLASSSGTALKEIVDLASSNSAVVASIATAAEEQSATSEEINRAIEEINHVVGETTEGMIQSSAAVQELSQMAQELRHVMESLQ